MTQAPPCHALSVAIEDSPYIDTFYKSVLVRITINSGCIVNIVSSSMAKRLGLTINKNSQNALQADKQSKLNVIGRATATVNRDYHKLRCDALVATDLEEDVLGGTVFQSQNDCYARSKQKLVYIGSDSYPYRPNQQDPVHSEQLR